MLPSFKRKVQESIEMDDVSKIVEHLIPVDSRLNTVEKKTEWVRDNLCPSYLRRVIVRIYELNKNFEENKEMIDIFWLAADSNLRQQIMLELDPSD